ncbi:MAG: M24 family metallopeptidase [Thermoanaerobaculia bacterium]
MLGVRDAAETRRADRLNAGLDELGAAALLVLASSSRDPDLAGFVGAVHLGSSFLLWPKSQPPLLGYLVDMERGEAAATGLDLLAPGAKELAELREQGASEAALCSAAVAQALENRGVAEGRLALAGHPPAGRTQTVVEALAERGFEFEDGQQLVRRLRKTKPEKEIDGIRAAAEGTCAAFRQVAAVLASAEPKGNRLVRGGVTLTAGALRRTIAAQLAQHDLEQPEGNIVACGSDAGVPHTQGSDDRELRPAESIVVDLYPRRRLFADCTRTFCIGRAGPRLAEAHTLCLQALEAATAAAEPGVSGHDLHGAACDRFEAAGFPTARSNPGTRTGYVHGLGHGVGYELHELPSFRTRAGADGELEVGDVITLEPGLYDPDAGWGLRLEDLLVVSESGAENLTPLPYDLDPRSW